MDIIGFSSSLEKLKRINTIYIAAPSGVATGGPELLHQFALKLKLLGRHVEMLYFPKVKGSPVHQNYIEYGVEWTYSIVDSSENLLVVPEVGTALFKRYKNIKKAIWWLSVDHYFLSLIRPKRFANRVFSKIFFIQKYLFFDRALLKVDYHFSQSKYAYEFLVSKGVLNPIMLSDFLHHCFLSGSWERSKKENWISYNPKKGSVFTKKVIKYCSDLNFVPIANMSRSEVVELLGKTKVYIDFGFHPGKDRIPREAAHLGNCIITNLRGAAYYSEDVPIPSEFKFPDNFSCIPSIGEKIRDCIESYDDNLMKFSSYRKIIKEEESVFECQVKTLFNNC